MRMPTAPTLFNDRLPPSPAGSSGRSNLKPDAPLNGRLSPGAARGAAPESGHLPMTAFGKGPTGKFSTQSAPCISAPALVSGGPGRISSEKDHLSLQVFRILKAAISERQEFGRLSGICAPKVALQAICQGHRRRPPSTFPRRRRAAARRNNPDWPKQVSGLASKSGGARFLLAGWTMPISGQPAPLGLTGALRPKVDADEYLQPRSVAAAIRIARPHLPHYSGRQSENRCPDCGITIPKIPQTRGRSSGTPKRRAEMMTTLSPSKTSENQLRRRRRTTRCIPDCLLSTLCGRQCPED